MFCAIASLVLIPVIQTSLTTPPVQAQMFRFLFGSRRPPLPLGTRSGVCPMSPGLLDKDFTVMSDRPLFLWQGQASKVTVRDYKTKAIVWTKNLDATTQQIVYEPTQPLESGKLYQWQVIGEESSSSDRAHWSTVAIMTAAERDALSSKLKEMEGRQKSAEAIADEQATYLLNQNLWSDALQVLFAVKSPSSAFVQKRQEFVSGLCTQDLSLKQPPR